MESPANKFSFWYKLALAIFILSALVVYQDSRRATSESTSNISELSGEQIEKIIAADGRRKLLFVFTSWCPYCKAQFPLIVSLEEAVSDYDFYYVSMDGDKADLARFISKIFPGVNRNIVMPKDPSGFLKILSKRGSSFNGGIPYIAVFDGSGKMRTEHVGAATIGELQHIMK